MGAAALKLDELRDLLRSKFPGSSVLDRPEYGVVSTGLTELDALLPGGIPLGAMTLITGGASCGKTGIALVTAARITQQEGRVAWVHDGSLSAPSMAHAGVVPENLLQVRAESTAQALRCTDFLLRWQAFHFLVLDWPRPSARGTAWNRLNRLVTGAPHALMVLCAPRPPGSPVRFCASIHLQVERRGIDTRVKLAKSRFAHRSDQAILRPRRMPGSPFALLPELPGLGQRHHEDWG
jgi:hypothetical protein